MHRTPRSTGWYWYQEREDKPLETVLVDRCVSGTLTVRRLLGPIQSPVPLSCIRGVWWGAVSVPHNAPTPYGTNQ
jgi:hypothetical protein